MCRYALEVMWEQFIIEYINKIYLDEFCMKCGDLRNYSSQQMACLAGKLCSKKRNIYIGVQYILFIVMLIINSDLLMCMLL
jgi:hypothetical protein